VSGHPLSFSRDGLSQAREALERASGAARKARLSALRDFLVRARALELTPGAAQEALELPRRPTVRLPGDPGLHGALPEGAVGRERRAAMESALAAAARDESSVRSALWEAAQAALSELGAGDPAEAVLSMHERGWSAPREPQPASAEAPPGRGAPGPGSPLL